MWPKYRRVSRRSRGSSAGDAAVGWNPADKSSVIELSAANLLATVVSAPTPNLAMVRAVTGRAVGTGVYYFEVTVGGSNVVAVGLAGATDNLTKYPGFENNAYGYSGFNSSLYKNASPTNIGTTYVVGDIIGVRLNNTGTVTFYKNGALVATSGASLTGTLYPAWGLLSGGSSGQTGLLNVGPSGFSALPAGSTPWG